MAAVTATIPTRRITARLDLPHLAALHSPRLPLFLIGRWLLTRLLAALLRLLRLLLTVVTLLLITLALPSCLRRFATTRRVPTAAGAVIVCLRA